MRRKRRKKGPVQSKKIKYDGIQFASGLERFCYMQLKKEKLFEGYENEKFTLIEGFEPGNKYYERQSNGKGDYTRRDSRKVLGITYTPDFCGKDFIIETKGRANESFPIRWKLFKRLLTKLDDTRPLYKPQTQSEVLRTIELIKESRR